MSALNRRQVYCFQCLDAVDEIRYEGGGTRPERMGGLKRLWAAMTGRLVDPTPADIVAWDRQGRTPLCPRGHELPPEPLTRRSYAFGLVGQRSSSKSHYLCSLVQQILGRGPLLNYGWTAHLTPTSGAIYHRTYYQPLYIDRIAIDATVPLVMDETRAPLIMELYPPAGSPRRPVNLVFFDASGEQLATGVDQARYAPFLYRTDALFLLVSPEALPTLRSQLSQGGSDSDPIHSISGLQTMFMQAAQSVARGRHGGSPDDRYLDMVGQILLTKADLLRDTGLLDREFFEETPLEGRTLADLRAEVDKRSITVRQLIAENDGKNLVGVLHGAFPEARFHAVSATGHAAGPDRRFPAVEPFGCLPPLLLALHQLGVIRDATKDDENEDEAGDY